MPGETGRPGIRLKAAGVKAGRASKRKAGEQLSSQENPFAISLLSATPPDTNFEAPQGSSVRLQDPAMTPPPSREATNRILTSPALSNQKSGFPPRPAPKGWAEGSLCPGFGMWAGRAFDVTGEHLLPERDQPPLSEAADQWSAGVWE